MANHIESLYEDGRGLQSWLEGQKETSRATFSSSWFRKVLLLSAASSFERQICDAIAALAQRQAAGDERTISLIKKKAITRQFHTYFNWSGANANAFFGLFGEAFSRRASAAVASDASLGQAVKSFLELGQLRNELVHQDFAVYPLEKTLEEVYALYREADRFVAWVCALLAEP